MRDCYVHPALGHLSKQNLYRLAGSLVGGLANQDSDVAVIVIALVSVLGAVLSHHDRRTRVLSIVKSWMYQSSARICGSLANYFKLAARVFLNNSYCFLASQSQVTRRWYFFEIRSVAE